MTLSSSNFQPHYFCSDFYRNTLLADPVKSIAGVITRALGNAAFVGVYPDAMYENWGIPTGLLFVTPPQSTILFPTFLRDPGCGFLLFKIKFSHDLPHNWHRNVGSLLNELVEHPNQTQFRGEIPGRLETILSGGLESIHGNRFAQDLPFFQHRSFDVRELPRHLTEQERNGLQQSLGTVSNTLELRTVSHVLCHSALSEWQIDEGNIIGLIHTGCGHFESILEKRFAFRIAEESINDQVFTLEEIERGIYGVTVGSELGGEYLDWIRMAMNFALVNRYLVFLAIRNILESLFSCQVTMVRDAIHCGILSEGGQVYKVFRGVQSMYGGMQGPPSPTTLGAPTLIAGHKESIAALVCAGSDSASAFHMIAHGTGWETSPTIDYGRSFTKSDITYFHDYAKRTYYNSSYQEEKCLPHTYNLLSSLDHFSKIELAQPVAYLAPLINIQGQKRRRHN